MMNLSISDYLSTALVFLSWCACEVSYFPRETNVARR